MTTAYINPSLKRIFLVTGHYGSGKTEFTVSLALKMAEEMAVQPYARLALVDLDIANPYFRSRERKKLLEASGVAVYGSAYDSEITAEIPALSASIRAPLEDKDCRVIVDAGGDESGARVLHQFEKYFSTDEHALLTVVNANRPETADLRGALTHLYAIECELRMRVTGIINNCHLLRKTTADVVAKGHRLCTELCAHTGKELWCDCYPAPLVSPEDLHDVGPYRMPLGMYMRETWLDK